MSGAFTGSLSQSVNVTLVAEPFIVLLNRIRKNKFFLSEMEVVADPTTLKSLFVGDKEFRSSTNHAFSQEDAEKALIEFNETEDLRRNSLRKLKNMLSKDDSKYRTDDAYLLRFLRCKKFKCKEAYEMILSLYSARKKHPEIFSSVPSHLEAFLKVKTLMYLPYRDEEGSIVVLDRLARWNPSEYPPDEGAQLVQILIDIISMNPSCQLHKVVAIIDLKDVGIKYFSPIIIRSALKLGDTIIHNINPIRVKRFILLNVPSSAKVFITAFKFMLKKKLADRILILGSDLSELHEHVNPAILPKEYGGNLDESQCTVTLNHILKNQPYLRYEYSFFNST